MQVPTQLSVGLVMSFPIDRYASVCLINTPSESGHCGRVGLLDVTRRDRRRVAAVNSALFLTTVHAQLRLESRFLRGGGRARAGWFLFL